MPGSTSQNNGHYALRVWGLRSERPHRIQADCHYSQRESVFETSLLPTGMLWDLGGALWDLFAAQMLLGPRGFRFLGLAQARKFGHTSEVQAQN